MKANLLVEKNGKFKVDNADQLSYLYFPLTNFKSLKSSITPSLNGDAKIDQNSFALLPVSQEDLSNSFMTRNVYFRVNNAYTWSITGNTPYQMLNKDKVSLEADFLVHKITRVSEKFLTETESFVPFNDTYQEWHKISLKNTTKNELTIKPVISIPLYSRSADNLRDHRHVTALLNKATIYENCITNKPTFSFDERGHVLNQNVYGVKVSSKVKVKNYWPVLQEFMGEGSNLLDPIVVKENLPNNYKLNQTVSGYEVTAGFEFEEIKLLPNEVYESVFILSIEKEAKNIINEDVTIKKFKELRDMTVKAWHNELSNLTFEFGDNNLNGWLKWVTLQPILRRIYGCSFLPHHDYGRGGRGWRDLWQDLLALILMDPKDVRDLLLNNFLGVRLDGSNATIIGDSPGDFKADRNNIARVWMDHGSWPLLTTMLYVDKSGDYQVLLENQMYFKDKFSHYTKKVNANLGNNDNIQRNTDNKVYKGSILEHLIIQNLVPFYNVGDHNNIRIEDADWNDALDMAHKNGESVAFTNLYASNLIELGNILHKLNNKGIKEIKLLKEIEVLLADLDFKDINRKRSVLNQYFDSVEETVSGEKITYKTKELAALLQTRGEYLKEHIRRNEWLESKNGSWFNGYYDGDGIALENADLEDITLTGQVFPVYSGTALNSQIDEIIKSVDKYLYDPDVGGYKLNTDFKELKQNMGRLFGFAYGHKENGAMFSHMAVMYGNALYKRGYAHAGNKVLMSIYDHCKDINKSKIYPGIPEYVDPNGRGMYHYLTGSASWLILTEVTEVFGIKADFGNLVLEPKLLKYQFDEDGKASIKTIINDKLIKVTYINKEKQDFGNYVIDTVSLGETNLKTQATKYGVKVLDSINEDITVILRKN